eukprot:CAMPEP_0204020292 /NCGR_PEP_ID=MMETSP0360-20130528/29326_1 /ASSEMBLY_ACC=CAM_ASM_000342 /TAXON_ID=268821 /ORGANISM="Scrippsiella Hangoei, Strain SHTV-5" /LENGTH=30 /DNA_ID= /DNA_START= /DNA_END= /DNA_ORIENTATION=
MSPSQSNDAPAATSVAESHIIVVPDSQWYH